MPFFMGGYSYALDEKGRVKIPSAFKADLAPADDSTVILVQDRDECIAVYTPEEYQKLTARLVSLDRDIEENRVMIHRQISCAFPCPVDAQGRVKIPAELIKLACLEKGGNVKLAGFIEYVQIWNPDLYQKSLMRKGKE